jgi:hypothetical protein
MYPTGVKFIGYDAGQSVNANRQCLRRPKYVRGPWRYVFPERMEVLRKAADCESFARPEGSEAPRREQANVAVPWRGIPPRQRATGRYVSIGQQRAEQHDAIRV